jgi:hypothetical protein
VEWVADRRRRGGARRVYETDEVGAKSLSCSRPNDGDNSFILVSLYGCAVSQIIAARDALCSLVFLSVVARPES